MAIKQMLSNLGLSSLEKLDSPLQWIDWNQRIKDALSLGGYSTIFRYPDKPNRRPTEDEDKFESRLEKWEEAQAQACSLIRSYCNQNARDLIRDINTATEMLNKLEAHYTPKGSAIFQALDLKYQSLSLADCKDINHFSEQLKAFRNELHALSDECKISGPHFINKFITSLGPSYDNFCRNFYQNHKLLSEKCADGTTIKAVTFEEAVMAAEMEEQAWKNNQQITALVTHQVQGSRSSKFCSHCVALGEYGKGHTKHECWKLHPEKKTTYDARRRARRNQKDRRQGLKAKNESDATLEHIGAVVAQAPLPVAEPRRLPGTERNILMPAAQSPIGQTFLQVHWLVDTGCSNHTTWRKDVFLPGTLKFYSGDAMQGFGGLSKRPYMIGTAQVACRVRGSLVYLQLTDCFYHPQAGCNIISTAQLRKKGATLCFTDSPPVLQ